MSLLNRWRDAWHHDRLRRLSTHIVILHVPLDWASTQLALAAARDRGLVSSAGELNPLIGFAASDPLGMLGAMAVVGLGIVGMLWVEDQRIARGRSAMTRSGMAMVWLAVVVGVLVVCLNTAQWLALEVTA